MCKTSTPIPWVSVFIYHFSVLAFGLHFSSNEHEQTITKKKQEKTLQFFVRTVHRNRIFSGNHIPTMSNFLLYSKPHVWPMIYVFRCFCFVFSFFWCLPVNFTRLFMVWCNFIIYWLQSHCFECHTHDFFYCFITTFAPAIRFQTTGWLEILHRYNVTTSLKSIHKIT